MQDIRGGEPFARRNVTRLRMLAAAVGWGVPIASLVRFVVTGVILGEVNLGTLPAEAMVEFPWLPAVVGGCVALLAEAFKAGSRLRDDVDGLV